MSAFKTAHSGARSGPPSSIGYFHALAALVKLIGSPSKTEGHDQDKRSGAGGGVGDRGGRDIRKGREREW